jgi:ABC-type multidrug transport system ATPase subunit
VPRCVRESLLKNSVSGLADAGSEVPTGAGHADRDLETGGAVALRERVERREAERRLHLARRLQRAAVVAQDADELIDVVHRLARDLLDRLEGRSRPLGILLAQEAGGAGLDEDDVDRMAGRVVEVTGDARAFLGGGQAALALCLALRPQSALLELGHALAAHPHAIAEDPRAAPDERSEEERNGGELITGETDGADVGDEETDYSRGGQPRGHARLFGARGQEIERNRRAERRAGRISEPVQRRARGSGQSEHGQRGATPGDQWQRRERREGGSPAVEIAALCVRLVDGPARGEYPERQPEDEYRDARIEQELSVPRHASSLARPHARRVSPAGYSDPPGGVRRTSSLGALWLQELDRTVNGMDDSFVIETSGLTKRYGERILAVDRLDLRVRRGEVYGFLGPNGAGKTTTLRMLLGLVRPTSGTALVLGAAPGSPEGLACVGALVETPSLYPFLSGRDNLRVLARHARVAESRIEAVLEEVELTDRASDHFATYSLGMKQRLGVAAALLKDPELLILDEPTNGMDPAGMADMRTFIRGLGRGRRTVFLSSHLMTEVEQICDRVGVIRSGNLVGEGTVADLRGRESLRVRAEPVAAAKRLLATLPAVERVTVADGGLHIAADPAAASAINRALVEAGIAVSELRREQASLEQVFLQLTQPEEEAA